VGVPALPLPGGRADEAWGRTWPHPTRGAPKDAEEQFRAVLRDGGVREPGELIAKGPRGATVLRSEYECVVC
jgi:hypothetical protein